MNQIVGRFCVEYFVGARMTQNSIALLIRSRHCTCSRLSLIGAVIRASRRELLTE